MAWADYTFSGSGDWNFRKKVNLNFTSDGAQTDYQCKQTIINTPDVNALLSFESFFEVEKRQYNVVFEVDTIYGPVSGSVSNG